MTMSGAIKPSKDTMSDTPEPSYANDMGLADDYMSSREDSRASTPTAASVGSSSGSYRGNGNKTDSYAERESGASSRDGSFDGRFTPTSGMPGAFYGSGSVQGYGDATSSTALYIPDSPAPMGYLPHPFPSVVESAQNLLDRELGLDASYWESSSYDDGVSILLRKRNLSQAGLIPQSKGQTFIPGFRPIEVLACIHLFSYRLIWDTRMSSGRILQRYSHHNFMFYAVFRGVGNLYRPRDAVGCQDARFWGPYGEPQHMALPNTDRIDLVYRSVDAPDVPRQEGKVRMHIELGGFRIQWRPELNGCDITYTGDADVHACIPSYLWNVLAKELPKTVGRLRDAMQKFGVPPYVVDLQDCVVLQMSFFYAETRKSTHRHHVSQAGSYSIIIDRLRMFPNGIGPVKVTGPGAHAVSIQEMQDQLLVTVAPHGVRLEYLIEIEPRDKLGEPDAQGGWW